MSDNSGVTGRDAILRMLAETKAISEADGERILQAIDAAGYVCVPRIPTAKMIEAASDEALAEDAAGVWRTMIAETEGLTPTEEEILSEVMKRFPRAS